jgi:tol-pal system protein YbgF
MFAMNTKISRALAASVLVAVTAAVTPAHTQGLFDNMFGRSERPAEDVPDRGPAQPDPAVEMERLEARIRQLTGQVEQLQYRNQQLEQQLRAMGGQPGQGAGAPMQGGPVGAPMQPGQAAAPLPPPSHPGQAMRQPGQIASPAPLDPVPVAPGGRRSDAFDPMQNPRAPGAPQPLGGIPPGSNAAPPPVISADEPVGAPGGRAAGAPLDLSTLSANAAVDPGQPAGDPNAPLPPPPRRNPNATGAATASVQPPSDTPKELYDLGYGFVVRKDYAQAESTLEAFLKKHPKDRLVPEANFWLGESLFQRQRYDAAAERFLDVSTKHASSAKAPDALLRLGQSLAALGQKQMACASLAEVGRKYPRASASVKQGVEREQKRAGC